MDSVVCDASRGRPVRHTRSQRGFGGSPFKPPSRINNFYRTKIIVQYYTKAFKIYVHLSIGRKKHKQKCKTWLQKTKYVNSTNARHESRSLSLALIRRRTVGSNGQGSSVLLMILRHTAHHCRRCSSDYFAAWHVSTFRL